jgi:hypothetical protein
MKIYSVKFDEYLGYHWDDSASPERQRLYPATRATEALREFGREFPGYQANSIEIVPEIQEK